MHDFFAWLFLFWDEKKKRKGNKVKGERVFGENPKAPLIIPHASASSLFLLFEVRGEEDHLLSWFGLRFHCFPLFSLLIYKGEQRELGQGEELRVFGEGDREEEKEKGEKNREEKRR